MTRQVIVDAARLKFAERGYEGATLRAIAQEARVDPALIHHFFSSKQGVFAAAIADVLKPAELIPEIVAPGLDGLGERLMRMLINLWESEKLNPLLAVIRSAVSHEEAAELLREFISTEVLGRLGSVLEPPLRDLRTALVGSQIVGLVMARYVVKVEPLASADPETLVAAISPTIQYYLASDISSDPAALPVRLPQAPAFYRHRSCGHPPPFAGASRLRWRQSLARARPRRRHRTGRAEA